jgi:uncharacterized protein
MRAKKYMTAIVSICVFGGSICAQASITENGSDELAPLKYKEIPLGNIKPKGWLRNQFEIMRSGSTGHLDEVYAKVMNDNGWLGGQVGWGRAAGLSFR